MDLDQMKFGFLPEPPNPKHYSYEEKLKARLSPFASYSDRDLRPFSPDEQRHNQGATGSCVAQGVVRGLEIRQNMVSGIEKHVSLSRLAVYYLAREMMSPSETSKDRGTYVSNGCDVLRRFGVCPETDWPFDTSKVTVSPPWMAMRRAYQHKIQAFYRITSIGQDRVGEVARCIQAGLPVVFGTLIGNDWSGATYRGDMFDIPPLTLPGSNIRGGHCTILIGTHEGTFIGENSWGTLWGDHGFYRMDPAVIAANVSSDFWVMENEDDPWTQGKVTP